jgi:hypothetical protein
MNLIVNQYDNSDKVLKRFKNSKDDGIEDVVFAIELGFKSQVNNRTFFHSHMFCFHYCLDSYEGEKNVSFEILSPNEQTGYYFFWNYTSNFYKPNEKSKRIQIENAQLTIPKASELFEIVGNESFESVIEKIKLVLWNKHENILKEFKDIGININDPLYMDEFSHQLKKSIEDAYKDIESSELNPFIKEYNAQVLNKILPINNNKTPKIKI